MGEHRQQSKKAKVKGNKKSAIKDFLLMFLYALIIAALLKTFIIDSRAIPTLSMYPTIDASDRVVLYRLAYIGDKVPERGDIVVFRPPAETGERSDLIKRVIGLPGETVEIKNGSVYIDGTVLTEDYLNAAPDYIYPEVTVPEGHYFMLGDNRNISGDSHVWANPFVSERQIKGQAIYRYWPLNRIGAI